MRASIKRNLPWWLLNISAAAIMLLLLRETGLGRWPLPSFQRVYQPAAEWAVRFLLFCLAMTPLRTLSGWRGANTLRKPAGLWAFGFAVLHLLGILDLRTAEYWDDLLTVWYWVFGIVALGILTLLAITSNRWAMRRLGKNWKRLHRLVYIAGLLALTHGLVSYAFSKAAAVSGQPVYPEYLLYLAILIVLLALRVPYARERAVRAVAALRRPRHTQPVMLKTAAAPSPPESE